MVKHEITVNSSYRENFNNTDENVCKFKILKPIYNVKSIELKSLYIPNSGYIVDVHNNLLPLKLTTVNPGTSTPGHSHMLIQLKCGDYSQEEILTNISDAFGNSQSWIVGELNNEIFKETTNVNKVYINPDNTNGWAQSYSLSSSVDDEFTFKNTLILNINGGPFSDNFGTTLSMGYANDLFKQTNPNYPGRLINSLIGLNMFTESHFAYSSTGSVLNTNRYNFADYPSLYMIVGNGRSNYENEYVYDSSSVNPAGSGKSSGGSVGIQNTPSKGFFGRIHMNVPVNSVLMLTNKELEVKYETRGEYDEFIDELNVSFYSDILNDVLYNFNNIQWEATFIIDGDTSRNNNN